MNLLERFKTFFSIEDTKPSIPPEFFERFSHEITDCHEDLLCIFVENHCGDLNERDSEGKTLLHHLCSICPGRISLRGGCRCCTSGLLHPQGCRRNPYGIRCRMISMLVQAGADVTVLSNEKRSVLHYLSNNIPGQCRNSDVSIDAYPRDFFCALSMHRPSVTLLNQVDTYGKTPLWYACDRGNQPLVAWLLLHHADPDKHVETLSLPPLHRACKSGHAEICKLLINAGANLNQKDYKGRSPQYTALQSGRKDILELFS